MATAPRQRATREIEYPTGDGKPMAETDVHRDDMIGVIDTLRYHFTDDPNVYISGNLLLYYEEGNPRKHVAPDVLVSFGVPKEPPREFYQVWKERKAPNVVIEITSKSTKRRTTGLRRTSIAMSCKLRNTSSSTRPRITSSRRSGDSAWRRASTSRFSR